MFFSVVMYGCESWTKKKAEKRRIDAFELWCWGRLLKVPGTARKSNQSILKGVHWKDWCWSWNSSTLATWCEELNHLKKLWCWERLRAGGEGDNRGWDGWMASPTQWTWVWVNSGSWWWTGRTGVLWFMGSQRVRHDWIAELNWTEISVEGNGTPLQHSCLENPTDRGCWWAAVHGVARVGHDWATSLCMKYSLGISTFLEEICSLSHSIVFLYFFALILFDNILSLIFVSIFMRDIGLYFSFEGNFILPTLLNRMGNILSFLNIWGNLVSSSWNVGNNSSGPRVVFVRRF